VSAVAAGGILWWLVKLLFENLFYGALMVQLKGRLGIDESDIIALVASNLIPIVLTAIIIVTIFRLALKQAMSSIETVRLVPDQKARASNSRTARIASASNQRNAKRIAETKSVWLDLRNFALAGAMVIAILISGWSMVKAITNGKSLLTVTNIIAPTNGAPPGLFGVNISIKNSGTAATVGLRHSAAFIESPSETVSDSIMEKASEGVLTQLKDSRKTLTALTETQVNAETYYTLNGFKEYYDNNKSGKTFLYLLTYIEYRDNYMPDGAFRVTEMCVRISPNGSFPLCSQHNKVYERE
jgi:hypothetical protein